MHKLIRGIMDFHERVRPGVRETFARLALEQAPDALLVACSDSRVAPNVFASTEPGDLFVVRNVGNLIPPCDADGYSVADESEAAAIEFALRNLRVRDVIICGHSECGAMQAILGGRRVPCADHLNSWLRHGAVALDDLGKSTEALASTTLAPHNLLSQLNVLRQLEHLRSYPVVQSRLQAGTLRLHGWWFDIAAATVSSYDPVRNHFTPIDGREGERLLETMGHE